MQAPSTQPNRSGHRPDLTTGENDADTGDDQDEHHDDHHGDDGCAVAGWGERDVGGEGVSEVGAGAVGWVDDVEIGLEAGGRVWGGRDGVVDGDLEGDGGFVPCIERDVVGLPVAVDVADTLF